jgi:demethylmenaquinone methyltransferase/2-methoxy-6-polyprenyl-1,4-benzoquinol methylase
MVLEFSKPRKAPFKQLYYFYFTRILPMLGRLISKDSSAYTYLPESVNEFPDGEEFMEILHRVGFINSTWHPQTFGIASIYKTEKPKN